MTTFRVTVRGKFDGLTDDVRTSLTESLETHDAMHAQFTEVGTFTYDKALDAFSFRYLITEDEPDAIKAQDNAHTQSELNSLEYLNSRDIGFRMLRVESMNMDDMKANTRRIK